LRRGPRAVLEFVEKFHHGPSYHKFAGGK
jgi:hypothetical protein